jgi:hypothetical protein
MEMTPEQKKLQAEWESREKQRAVAKKDLAADYEKALKKTVRAVGEERAKEVIDEVLLDLKSSFSQKALSFPNVQEAVRIEAIGRTGVNYNTIEDVQRRYQRDFQDYTRLQKQAEKNLVALAKTKAQSGNFISTIGGRETVIPQLGTGGDVQTVMRNLTQAHGGTPDVSTLAGGTALAATGGQEKVDAVRGLSEEAKDAARMSSRARNSIAYSRVPRGDARRRDVRVHLDQTPDGRVGMSRDIYKEAFRVYHFDLLSKKREDPSQVVRRDEWESINKEATKFAEEDIQKILRAGYGVQLYTSDPGGAREAIQWYPKPLRPFRAALTTPEQYQIESGVAAPEIHRGRGYWSKVEGILGKTIGSYLTMPEDPNVDQSFGSDAHIDWEMVYNAEADIPIRIGKAGAEVLGDIMGSEEIKDNKAVQRSIGLLGGLPLIFLDPDPFSGAVIGLGQAARATKFAVKGTKKLDIVSGAYLAGSGADGLTDAIHQIKTLIAEEAVRMQEVVRVEEAQDLRVAQAEATGDPKLAEIREDAAKKVAEAEARAIPDPDRTILRIIQTIAEPDVNHTVNREITRETGALAHEAGVVWPGNRTASLLTADALRSSAPKLAADIESKVSYLNKLKEQAQAKVLELEQQQKAKVAAAKNQGRAKYEEALVDYALNVEAARAKYQAKVHKEFSKFQLETEQSILDLIQSQKSPEMVEAILLAAIDEAEAVADTSLSATKAKAGKDKPEKMSAEDYALVKALGNTWAARVRQRNINEELIARIVSEHMLSNTQARTVSGRLGTDGVRILRGSSELQRLLSPRARLLARAAGRPSVRDARKQAVAKVLKQAKADGYDAVTFNRADNVEDVILNADAFPTTVEDYTKTIPQLTSQWVDAILRGPEEMLEALTGQLKALRPLEEAEAVRAAHKQAKAQGGNVLKAGAAARTAAKLAVEARRLDEMLAATLQVRRAESASDLSPAALKAAQEKAAKAGRKAEGRGVEAAEKVERATQVLKRSRAAQAQRIETRIAALQTKLEKIRKSGFKPRRQALESYMKEAHQATEKIWGIQAKMTVARTMPTMVLRVLERTQAAYRSLETALRAGLKPDQMVGEGTEMASMLSRAWEDPEFTGFLGPRTYRSWVARVHQLLGGVGAAFDAARAHLGDRLPEVIQNLAKSTMLLQDYSNGAIGQIRQFTRGDDVAYQQSLVAFLNGDPVALRRGVSIFSQSDGSPWERLVRYLRFFPTDDVLKADNNDVLDALAGAWLPRGVPYSDPEQIAGAKQLILNAVGKEGDPIPVIQDVTEALREHWQVRTASAEDMSRAMTFFAQGTMLGSNMVELLLNLKKLEGPAVTTKQAQALNGFLHGWSVGGKGGEAVTKGQLGYRTPAQLGPKGEVLVEEQLNPFSHEDVWKTFQSWGLNPFSDRTLGEVDGVMRSLVRVSTDPTMANFLPASLLKNINEVAGKIVKEGATSSVISEAQAKVYAFLSAFARVWRTSAVVGYIVVKPGRMVTVFAGDWGQLWTEAGAVTSGRRSIQSSFGYFPFYGTQAQDAASRLTRTGAANRPTLFASVFNPHLDMVFGQDPKATFKLNGKTTNAARVHKEMIEDQVFDTFLEADLLYALKRPPRGRVTSFLTGAQRSYGRYLDAMRDYYTYAQSRQRAITYLDVYEKHGRAEAKRRMLDAHFDWRFAGTRWEMTLFNTLIPFYTYFRNAERQYLRALMEPMTLSGAEVMQKALRGRLKIQRTRQQVVTAKTLPDWYWWDDPDEMLNEQEQRAHAAKNIFPWWIGGTPLLGTREMSPELITAWETRTGKIYSHEALTLPFISALDMVYLNGLATHLMMGSALAMAGEPAALEEGAWERAVDEYTDLMGPILSQVAQSGIKGFSKDFVPVNEAQFAALQQFGFGPEWVQWNENDRPRAHPSLRILLESLPIVSTEVLPMFRDINNPAWDISRKEGAKHMVARLFRIAKPVPYSPEDQLEGQLRHKAHLAGDRKRNLREQAEGRNSR